MTVACAACDKHLEDEKEGWRAGMLRDTTFVTVTENTPEATV